MKQTSRGLAPSLNTGHSTFTGARQRLAVALVAIFIAFAGAQTAGAQTLCKFRFDISGKGTVKLQREGQWLEVTNGEIKDCIIPSVSALTITPETGYYVSSVTYDATDGLSIKLIQYDDFQWSLNIVSYEGSETPTITVHIVFDKGLAGGADEASAVALTADDDLSHLTGGWYKVESDLTFGHTVNLHGDTHITIATGKTLTVSTSDQYGISGSALTVSGEGTLAVSANRAIYVDNYTQTGCAVTLSGYTDGLHAKNNVSISGGSLTTSRAFYGISADNGAITISGGTVSSSGLTAGLFANKAMNITGGTVSASGDNDGIRGYSVSITGGQVTASSGGIRSNYGDITLGWTSATDYITASGFTVKEGFYVKIADGQKLYGGGFPSASYTGTVGDPSALNGKTLRPTAAVTESGTNEYTIWNADGWGVFCDALQDNDTYNRFSGKTVKLGADITVTRCAGSGAAEDLTANDRPFCGTFDGGGNKLTFKYGSADSPADENNIAPFRYVNNATIQHLHVDGDIYTRHTHAGGIVGQAYGTTNITDCRSSVNIISSITGDGTHGGIMSCSWTGSTTSITGCLFDGSIQSASGYTTNQCGGFVGWRNATINVSNSLLTADLSTIDTPDGLTYPSATFVRNGHNNTITNCYYTQPFGTAQGKALHTVTAGTDVTVAHAGVATHYATSGITAYKATGASADSDPFIAGLLYNNNVVDVLYAGSDDVVSLTLSNTATGAPDGYQYAGYTASAGTLDGSTLTMPAANVTVSLGLRSTNSAVPVSYLDADGNTQTHDAIALDGAEIDLGAGWYFVGLPTVAFDHSLTLNGDVNIILADGCTLDVEGIYITQGSTLTIYAQSDGENAGRIVSHPTSGAAIGGMTGSDNGNIVIYGGNIEAAGGDNCAGIGSADGRTGGTITIYGGTVTAKGGENGAAIGGGRYCDGGTITIYGGTITANGPTDTDTCENGAGIGGGEEGNGGNITINGGNITTYSRDGAGIGGGDDGDGGTITINGGEIASIKVNQGQGARIGGGLDAGPGTITINGGTITTEGGSGAGIGGGKRNAANGTVTINGGVINASGSYGIGAGEGGANFAIILGWTSTDDRITASTYGGNVIIADGKSFHNGSEVLEPCTVADMDKLKGKTLIGVDVLQDDAANDVAALATRLGGKQTNIALSGRKLWKDGDWNTLCLPFAIADIEADGCPLKGATVRELNDASITGTTLTLNFDAATTAIAAGVPYIVKWADGESGQYTQDPVFQGVTIDAEPHNYDNQAGGDTNVRFIGTYDQKTIDTEDRSILFLGAANTLYYPSGHSATTIGPFRAYFKIGPDDAPAANARQLTAFNLTFGDENETTGISDATTMPPGGSQPPVWRGASGYTLDGRKLQGQPTRKGLYIHGGKMVVIK